MKLTVLGFWDTNGSPNPGQATRPYNEKKKKKSKKNLQIVDFAVSAKIVKNWKEGYVPRSCKGIEKNRGTWKWRLYQL